VQQGKSGVWKFAVASRMVATLKCSTVRAMQYQIGKHVSVSQFKSVRLKIAQCTRSGRLNIALACQKLNVRWESVHPELNLTSSSASVSLCATNRSTAQKAHHGIIQFVSALTRVVKRIRTTVTLSIVVQVFSYFILIHASVTTSTIQLCHQIVLKI